VAVTGYGLDTDRERSKAAGLEAHLVKPVDIEKLVQVCENNERALK
jgi:CheY-like chemotaxis protein